MQRITVRAVWALAFALVAAPGALAAWSSHGGLEPDYLPDVTADLMFADPDTSGDDGHRQVYLNVVMEPFWTGTNPNVAATGSHFLAPGFDAPAAFLGVWKDCNQDGYVGAAETALLEYRSEILADESVCPDGGTFNDDGWVVEFLWIVDGSARPANALPYRYINDTGVKVWGDSGLPPAEQPTPGGEGGDGACYVNPPRGAFSSTGALLDFADCLNGHAIAETITALDEGTLCVEDTCPGVGLGLGIGFGEHTDNPQCSDSLLNQPIGLWDAPPECPDRFPGYVGLLDNYEGQQHATWGAWDCSGDTMLRVEDPRTPGAYLVNREIPTGLAPRVGETPGSAYEGLNETYTACNENAAAPGVNAESDVEQADAKVTNQYVLTYRQSVTSCPAVNAPDPVGRQTLPANTPVTDQFGCVRTNPGGPSNYGARVPTLLGYVGLYEGPVYFSGSSTASTIPFTTVELRDGDPAPTVDGAGAYYWTFYAHVTAAGLALPGASAQYGAEWCGSDYSTDRIAAGFDCNADHWWNPLYGASAAPRSSTGRVLAAVPGDTYNLRDTDCFDGSVAGKYAPGVGLGLTWLDAQPDEDGTPQGSCYVG